MVTHRRESAERSSPACSVAVAPSSCDAGTSPDARRKGYGTRETRSSRPPPPEARPRQNRYTESSGAPARRFAVRVELRAGPAPAKEPFLRFGERRGEELNGPTLRAPLAPQVAEPRGAQLGVPDGVVDRLVAEVRLQRPGIHAVVGQLEASRVPQHVGMHWE